MNHAKYIELLDRVEGVLVSALVKDPRDLAVAIVQALMPELDAPAQESTDAQALTQIGLLVKIGAEQQAELTRIVTRMQGSLEKLNMLQTADKKILTDAVARIETLEKFGRVGASFPKDWTVATVVNTDSLCRGCRRPKEICICPTLGGGT